jgi:hypothetical protein
VILKRNHEDLDEINHGAGRTGGSIPR